jgi:PhnB protein
VGSPIEKEQNRSMKSVIPALAVADVAASLKFYNDVLGFETTFTMPDERGELVHGSAKRGGVEIMVGRVNPEDPHNQAPLGRGFVLYTTVADDEDIDALFDRAKARGAKIVAEPMDQFWGHRDWTIADPDGYMTTVSKVVAEVTEEQMRDAMLAGAPAD